MQCVYSYERDKDRKPLMTTCTIVDSQGNPVAIGRARCNPNADYPDKNIGKFIATNRAWKALTDKKTVLFPDTKINRMEYCGE